MSVSRAALAALALVASGCVTVDATLRTDGSARLLMVYRTDLEATEFLERRRFSSPNVTVDAAKIFEDQTTAVWAIVHDVTRLAGSKGFEHVAVAREPRGRDEVVTITLENPSPVAEEKRPGPSMQISVNFPGPVREANHAAAVAGSRLTWIITKREYVEHPAVVLRARYTPPPR